MKVLAVDPGARFTGICYGSSEPEQIFVIQMPKIEFINRLLFLREEIQKIKLPVDKLIVEWPYFMQGRPGQDQVYGAAGIIIGALSYVTNVSLISPSTWKKSLGLRGNASKRDIKMKIIELYPVVTTYKQDVYDAIAIWASMKENGEV